MTATTIARDIRHGGQVLTANIHHGQVIVIDRPAHLAGTPGTVTAAQSAEWTEADWRALATSRTAALRDRAARANLRGPRSRTSSAWDAAALAVVAERQPKREITVDADGDVVVTFGGLLVEDWRPETVPALGRVWACYPPGHAQPVRYASQPPRA